MSDKPFQDKTAADDKSIGFDYQYYYFLKLLLELRHGQKIGLEVLDDVHLELPDNKLALIQLKHTTQTKSDSTAINLTERDVDLWKTIYNWVQLVNDKTQSRGTSKSQLEFIENTDFILVSNKQASTTNNFLTKISEFIGGTIDINKFEEYLEELYTNTEDSTTNAPLRKYILEFKSQKSDWKTAFLKKLTFQLNEDDLIAKIKITLKEKVFSDETIDDVYNCLNSNLRDLNYLNVKSKNKIFISFDDFRTKFRNCFGTTKKLPIRKLEFVLPDNPKEQMFIKQLIDIGDISESDDEIIIEFTRLKLLMYNNLMEWEHKGELMADQKKAFVSNCINQWKNTHRSSHRQNQKNITNGRSIEELEEEIKTAGLDCLDQIRKLLLSIEGDLLDSETSNGQFYLLSDELKIGWHIDWENKYKK